MSINFTTLAPMVATITTAGGSWARAPPGTNTLQAGDARAPFRLDCSAFFTLRACSLLCAFGVFSRSCIAESSSRSSFSRLMSCVMT